MIYIFLYDNQNYTELWRLQNNWFFICFANEKTRSRVIFTTAFAAQPTGTNGNIHGLFMFSNTLLNRLIHRDLD